MEKLPRKNKRIFFSDNDGMDNLNAFVPPAERRGLIFLDPSFEMKTDYRNIPKALKTAYNRFATGVYCLWYPLVDKGLHEQLLRGLKSIGAENNLRVEFYLSSMQGEGMTGCGLWIINPPYVLAEEIKLAFNALRKLFNPGGSSYLIEN